VYPAVFLNTKGVNNNINHFKRRETEMKKLSFFVTFLILQWFFCLGSSLTELFAQDYCDSDGMPISLTLEYTGGGCAATNHNQDPFKVDCSGSINPSLAITVTTSTSDYIITPTTVNLNQTFTVTKSGGVRLNSEVDLALTNVGGTEDISFHTSCSQPLEYGDVFGSLTLVDYIGDKPVAADDIYNTNKDTTLNVAAPGVMSNDSDADGDPLTALLSTDVSNGVLSLISDGSFSYTPNSGFFGTDSFTYIANDGANNSNAATVMITVNADAVTIQDGCMNDLFNEFGQGGGLNCTANDIQLSLASLNIIDGCDYPGDTAEVDLGINVTLVGGPRHDIGIYLALDGGNALTGTCSISILPYSPSPSPYTDLDGTGDSTMFSFGYCSADGGSTIADSPPQPCNENADCDAGESCEHFGPNFTQDTCGDIDDNPNPIIASVKNITVSCIDDDGDGFLDDLDTCSSWRQPGINELCLSPLAVFPGAPSKCWCSTITLNVPVPLDTDGDGVIDDEDICPLEDATGQDADGDGCIDAIEDFPQIVEDLNLPMGTENSLKSKIKNIQKSIDAGKIKTAINQLNAFINQVNALRGKKISNADADMLIQYATNLINSLTP
jgi:hypothetical protein